MTEDEMLRFVTTSFPGLPINNVQTNISGWDNDIIILNEEVVFRFPKTRSLLAKMNVEGKILELLKEKKPMLQIPAFEYMYSGNKLKGVKYDFLEGRSLSEFPEINLRENPGSAKSIGDFLTKLHSLDASELKSSGLGTAHSFTYWESLYTKAKSGIYPFLTFKQQREASAVFEGFLRNFPGLAYKKAVIHGDLTASNIIYSKEKRAIQGIIDFTDAQIGDPAFDFAGLYWDFGLEFTEDVLEWYNGTENKKLILERVQSFYGLQPLFHELLHAIEVGQKMDLDSALDKFSRLYKLARQLNKNP